MRHNLVLVVVFLLSGTTALGQYSLGTGEGLDGNTSSLGRINSPGALPNGVRNSAIRGNNIMRGTDFNGALGRPDDASLQLLKDAANSSDASYQDALYNSPWYWNNWSQQSAQFLKQGDRSYFNPAFIDNWSTSPQQMSNGRSIRSYSHAWNEKDAIKNSANNIISYDKDWSSRQKDQFLLGQVLGSGSQTSSYDTSSIPVGQYQTNSAVGYLTASPMTGVSLQTSAQPTAALGFSPWDAARATEDQAAGIGSDTLVTPWRTSENRLDYGVVENRISVPDQYINVLDSIEDRAQQLVDGDGIDETNIDWLDSQYATLQDELAGIATEDDEELAVEPDELATDEIYASLLHGERIGTFSGIEQNRFNELVQKGEMAIAGGEYFLAEKRFNQALRFIPGHPMATAGVGHANIGAGLLLSASHTLQSLFTFQPEMIGVRYEPQLLPPRIDLVRAAVSFRNRLDEERDGGTYAFLLAYIGYQLQDKEMIAQGIAELEKRANENDPVVPMLKYIWLDGGSIRGE
tara:strand:- start:20 stop:1576 length:1557 start_codon:yes stop_codon:yes gene_type:complete